MQSILGFRKGQVPSLADGVLQIGILALVVVIVAALVANVRDTQTQNSTEYNLSGDALTGIAEYGNWFTILVLVLIGSVIIVLLRSGFGQAVSGA